VMSLQVARVARGAATSAGAVAGVGRPLLSVAPMMDYTDRHYRYLFRLMSREAVLWTEMVAANKIVHAPDEALLQRFLGYSEPFEHPLVLQLGGSDPKAVREAAKVAAGFNYNEVNLNCGCPSERVADKGCFGAALMKNKELVGELMNAVQEGMPGVPVSVKCRIGVDEMDSYEELVDFVGHIKETAAVEHFIVHARKAMLGKKFSPADNRSVPPLRRDRVLRLVEDFPDLKISINGGITTYDEVNEYLGAGCVGAMVGRAAIHRPFYWSRTDELIYGHAPPANSAEDLVETPLGAFPRRSRGGLLQQYVEYAEEQLVGQPIRNRRFVSKPLQNLFSGEARGKKFRAYLDSKIVSDDHGSFSEVLWAAAALLPSEVLAMLPEDMNMDNLADFDGSGLRSGVWVINPPDAVAETAGAGASA